MTVDHATSSPQWFRTHGATPFLSGGVFMVFVVALLFRGFHKEVSRDTLDLWILGKLGLIGLFLIALIVVGNYLVWRNRYFALDGNYFFHRSGRRNKSTVKLELTQVNGVDLERNATAKILGFTALTVRHPAGDNVTIKYLRLGHGRDLRTQILDASRGSLDASGPSLTEFREPLAVPSSGPQHLYKLPLNRQLKSLALTWIPTGAIATVLALCGLAVLILLNRDTPEFWELGDDIGSIASLILQIGLATIAGAAAVVKIVSKNYGFVTKLDGKTFEVTRGLLSDLSTTVPLAAVHWIELRQAYMWRGAGWWRLSVRCVTAAGGDDEDDDEAGTQIVSPVATVREINALLDLLSTHVSINSDLILAAANRTADLTAVSSRRTRFFHPFTHGHTGYFLDDQALLVRNGRLSTRLIIIPLNKIQGLAVSQGVIQRKIRVANVVIHGAKEARSSEVPNLEDRSAYSLFEKLLLNTRSQNFNNPVSPIR